MEFTFFVEINIREWLIVSRYKNKPLLLQTAANRYRRYLVSRFRAMSARGYHQEGDDYKSGRGWPKLSERRLVQKEYRGIAKNPNWILRETDQLINSIDVETRGDSVLVGVVHDIVHTGYLDDKPIGMRELVEKHQTGKGHLPKRIIIVAPPKRLRRKMTKDIKDEYSKILRASRRRSK